MFSWIRSQSRYLLRKWRKGVASNSDRTLPDVGVVRTRSFRTSESGRSPRVPPFAYVTESFHEPPESGVSQLGDPSGSAAAFRE